MTKAKITGKVQFAIPIEVWDDYLNPVVTGAQRELFLPTPRHRETDLRREMHYRMVPKQRALELAAYMRDRAEIEGARAATAFERKLHRVAGELADVIETFCTTKKTETVTRAA